MTVNEAIKILEEHTQYFIPANDADALYTVLDIIQQYREIGTAEECREAAEKQRPKKPEVSDSDFDYYKCPVCGAYIWATDCVQDHNYCLNCGQAIDWEESEE